ncbi:MAG TPA: cysteine--tRNA ligase [Hyphomicrobiaceae bacterium]|nr:cysteine--tRNA ligase [Hyphomicrobiaceae bacterium]
MTLTLYNTLTRRKEPFRPIDPKNVRMYVCGPTVYDFAHIGNARPVIVFDVLFRLLRHIYGADHVTYARNITDVDDKINARAAEEYPNLPLNEAIARVTEKTEKQFHEDIAALGVLEPTVEPRATQSIPEMRALIETLVAKGHAYVADSHVLFDVASMPDYGRLANRSLEEMEAGARVDVAPYKKGPMDFVLWKPSKPGEPAWPSPAGIAAPGRPGWHIECSAMADRWLWQEPKLKGLLTDAGLARPHVFDIHGGGIDLVFPHHENEIAQSRCAHGTPVMANYWMHNGFLQVEGEKMSKSLGNFVTINELLQEWPGEAIKLAMLSTQYRQPTNWTEKGLVEAKRSLDHWYELTADAANDAPMCADVLDALQDDLNTPQAIAALHALRSEAAKGAKPAAACLKASARLMGLLQLDAASWKSWRPASLTVDETKIAALIAARSAARKAKNFEEADRIRDELSAMGIQLKDSKDPATGEIVTTWEVKR